MSDKKLKHSIQYEDEAKQPIIKKIIEFFTLTSFI